MKDFKQKLRQHRLNRMLRNDQRILRETLRRCPDHLLRDIGYERLQEGRMPHHISTYPW